MEARKDEIKYDVGDKDAYMHGKQLEAVSSDDAAKIYNKTAMAWGDCKVELGGGTDPKSLTPPIRFLCLQSQEQQLIEGKPNEARTLRQEFEYDGFGNQILNASLGEKDKLGDEQITRSKYITPQNPEDVNAIWLLRYAEKMEYCDGKDGKRCAEVRNFYDGEAYKGLEAGQIRKGNLTRTQTRTTLGKDDLPTNLRFRRDRGPQTLPFESRRQNIEEEDDPRPLQIESIRPKSALTLRGRPKRRILGVDRGDRTPRIAEKQRLFALTERGAVPYNSPDFWEISLFLQEFFE